MKEKKLTIFSVGSVLLNERMGAVKDVLVILGKGRETEEIDEEYQRRKFAGPWGLEELAKIYKGFSRNDLKEAALKYCQENLRSETREVLIELKKRGHILGALSANFQFIMDALLETLPLDFSEGSHIEFEEELATGGITKKTDRYMKTKILKEKMRNYGIEKENVIVIGHSITDLPMVKEAGVFVAFAPKEKMVKDGATILMEKKDLREILKYFD